MNLTEVLPSNRKLFTVSNNDYYYKLHKIWNNHIIIDGGTEEPCWGRALNKNPLQLEQLYLKGDFRIV